MAPRPLTEDLSSLNQAISACRGRVDRDVTNKAQAVASRIGRRIALSGDITVVAIAGPTGSGKSTLFNALTRTALAQTGVHRPMTREAMAMTFGSIDSSALLDWLGISRRHVTAGQGLDGIVLLDLADYDSVESSHREEVDRLVEVVDAFLWVVDPQKYADATLHEGYIARFSDHAEVMGFVLNQIDRMRPEEVSAVHADFARILKSDGINDPQIFEVSAVTEQGLDTVRHGLQNVATGKRSVAARLRADIGVQARSLMKALNPTDAGEISKDYISSLGSALSEAAGVDEVGQAVRTSWKRRGAIATGWPIVSWISGLRVDPLKRLHLDQFKSRKKQLEDPSLTRTSLTTHPVSRARVDTAIRTIGDQAMSRLPLSWRPAVDKVVKERSAGLPDKIDQTVAHTDLGLGKGQTWWTVVRILQWLILIIAVVGLGWLAVNFISSSYLALPDSPMPKIGHLPVPTLLAIGGVIAGILLAIFSRIGVALGARVKAAGAVRRLHKAIDQLGWAEVIDPINDELRRHDTARAALAPLVR